MAQDLMKEIVAFTRLADREAGLVLKAYCSTKYGAGEILSVGAPVQDGKQVLEVEFPPDADIQQRSVLYDPNNISAIEDLLVLQLYVQNSICLKIYRDGIPVKNWRPLFLRSRDDDVNKILIHQAVGTILTLPVKK